MKWVRLTLLETAGILEALQPGGEESREDAIEILDAARQNAIEEDIPSGIEYKNFPLEGD